MAMPPMLPARCILSLRILPCLDMLIFEGASKQMLLFAGAIMCSIYFLQGFYVFLSVFMYTIYHVLMEVKKRKRPWIEILERVKQPR